MNDEDEDEGMKYTTNKKKRAMIHSDFYKF